MTEIIILQMPSGISATAMGIGTTGGDTVPSGCRLRGTSSGSTTQLSNQQQPTQPRQQQQRQGPGHLGRSKKDNCCLCWCCCCSCSWYYRSHLFSIYTCSVCVRSIPSYLFSILCSVFHHRLFLNVYYYFAHTLCYANKHFAQTASTINCDPLDHFLLLLSSLSAIIVFKHCGTANILACHELCFSFDILKLLL